MKKILFVLKYRDIKDPNDDYNMPGTNMSSGLLNSARMVSEMLNVYGLGRNKCESKIVQVKDNNGIDKEVFDFKPDIVIIEAIWVVPEKFKILTKLHPNVKWIIRNHSNIPFIAGEGNAIDWLAEYVLHKNVFIATNTLTSLSDLKTLVANRVPADIQYHVTHKVVYFPNYYLTDLKSTWYHKPHKHHIDVGCFGAVRPLKNHLTQAFAAIKYCKKHNKKLRFHVNSGRPEGGGSSIVKNLIALFKNSPNTELIEHSWLKHEPFMHLIGTMDISLQVSFSETFNIVTADAVQQGVPVVVSAEINWVSAEYQALPTNTDDIVAKMELALRDAESCKHHINQQNLESYNLKSARAIAHTIISILHQPHDIDIG